ncbi:gag-pol polyprotein [Lasius niger]|uniref:Gag-pol polyprotein n=1 Tax=Lasius niger TaxID=67767 RepID=A0A0J7KDE2_LASNI|nr:gag-pol polyprotein [Lasius niger]
MSDNSLLRQIKRFDGTGFQAWKFQVTAVLVANEIFDVVDGTRVKPEDAANAANAALTKTWVRDNAKAMAIIASAMENDQLESLLVCTSAKDMWDRLNRIHEQKSATNKLILTQRFHEYRMCPTDTAVQHCSKVQNMAKQLTDLGEPVSDLTVMAKILASLTSKFSTLQTAWDSVDPDRQTIDNLQERLIREESRLETSTDAASALAVTKSGGFKKNTKKKDNKEDKRKPRTKKNIECYRCQEKGHYASECPQKRRNPGDRDKDDSNSQCAFVCEVDDKFAEVSCRYSQPTEEQARHLLGVATRDVWFTDSGASAHMTSRRDWFTEFHQTSGETVYLGDDGVCEVSGTGNIKIERLVNGLWESATIEEVLYVPRVKKNLFSVGMCTSKGFRVEFGDKHVKISRANKIAATGIKQSNQLYRLFFRVPNSRQEANVSSLDMKVWHERLGHIHKRALCELVNKEMVQGVSVKNMKKFFCEACQLGKLHKLPFKKLTDKQNWQPGELIHSDVCGPMSVQSPGGARFFLTFKDDFSDFRYVYFLRHKSDVLDCFKEYEQMISNKFGRTMKILRADNGREYCNAEVRKYLSSKGITMQNTAPYTPEQNGKSERDNRTIVESARTMLLSKNLPKNLWAEAVNTAVYTLNRTGLSRTGGSKTPFELWTDKKPNLTHLRIFGSEAFTHVPSQLTTKFDARARKVILVGYQGESANYRLYSHETKKVTVSRDVIFHEQAGGRKSHQSEESNVNFTWPDHHEELNENRAAEVVDGVAAVQREEVDKEADNDKAVVNNKDPESENSDSDEPTPSNKKTINGQRKQQSAETCGTRTLRNRASLKPPARYELNLAEYHVPETFEEAISGPESTSWKQAIKEELEAHEKNNTWKLVPRVSGTKTIDSKWVFKVIQSEDGSIRRFKARLCARGFQQRRGIDYGETFSPVVRYDSLRTLLAIITQDDLEALQFDVRTAFLHGELSENIWMEVPVGLNINKEVGDRETLVCECSCFVGLQISRDRINKTMFVHQTAYTRRLINNFGMQNAKGLSVPADPHTLLYPVTENRTEVCKIPYREAVGSLIFLAVVSRPDISYAVNNVSKFLNNHDTSHWQAVKRIIAYLVNTIGYGIEYRRNESGCELIGFSDADFASDIETRRSTTGYAFLIANGLVSWSSQRQKLVSLSTTESEYIAASSATREAIWLRNLLHDIGHKCKNATLIHIDNQSAIRLVKNPEFHKRTKHVDIRYHYIREKVESRDIQVTYIPTENQLADIFTKALPRDRFRKLCTGLGICDKAEIH